MIEHSPRLGEDRATWLASAAAVLRTSGRLGADEPDDAAWAKLARRALDGVEVPPIGTPSDVEALPTAAALAADPGQAPFLRGSRPTAGWDVRAHVAGADPAGARRVALAELAGGVTSLWIAVGAGGLAPGDLPAALEGVDLTIAPVVLQPSSDAIPDAGRALAALAGDRGARLHPGGSLGADPIGAAVQQILAADGHRPSLPDQAPTTTAAVEIAAGLGIGAIVVDAAALHDAGAIDTLEIGYSLAAGAAYLRILTAAGVDIGTACRLISFRYAVTDEQFTQIAKLRAARLAWARVCELSGASPAARAQHQHAVTSAAMLTRYDAHTNMLRGTVATFAAAAGGADAITTRPFDSALAEPDGFARRMARNVSALLIGESGLDRVADPSGGAGAVEMLTSRLAQSAWSEFTSIERSGGIDAAVADGSLAAAVARARADRDRRIATRRRPITGVSEFPDAAESSGDLPPRPASSATGALHRWSEPFEAMRDDPPPHPMLLVRIGTEAAASPRVTFARNLLAAGGVAVTEVEYDGVGGVSAAAAMLAGADRDYADHAADALDRLRAAGVPRLFVAGRPKNVDIDAEAVAVGDDVLTFLSSVRVALGGAR